MTQTKMRINLIKTWFNCASAPAKRRGQIMIEYALMFAAIVVAIIFGARYYIQPSMNHLFKETGDVINNIADEFVSGAYTWE